MTIKCKGNCQTFIGNRSTGAVFCADCGAAPTTPALQQPEAEFDAAVAEGIADAEAGNLVDLDTVKAKWASRTDELGKVWDVLHAAGINSGGELSASEGVKLLAGRFTGELMDAYQALQEDFAKLKAREDTARTLLHDASVSLYAKGMSQYEQPRVAMIAWLEG